MAHSALGQSLYLSGEPVGTRPQLEELVRRVAEATQPVAVVISLAVLSLLAGDEDDDRAALALARRAVAVAETQGLGFEPLCGFAFAALGRALARRGELAEAEEPLGRALEVLGIDSVLTQRAYALLLLAPVRRGSGDLPGARALAEEARELIDRFVDPGGLRALLKQTDQALVVAPRRRLDVAEPLTERELAVLRLLATQLSNREIGRELYVSINTVRTHIQAIYRKLDVATRAEAVALARELGLLSGPAPPGPDG
jgi:LuxR family maltose regulon positive regulatory protein